MKMLQARIIDFIRCFLIFIPIMFLFWLISQYSVNGLFWDDFEPINDYISMRTSGKIDWGAIVAFQNEHRIIIPRIIIILVGALTHWNIKIVVYISALLLSLAYFVFVKYTVNKKIADFKYYDIFYALTVGFCLFSCCQYENLLWSFQIAWFLIEFCAILGVTALSLYIKTGKNKYIYLMLIFGVISSFSSLHGLIIWPCYVAVTAIYQIAECKFDKKIWGFLVPLAAISLILYFIGYHRVDEHERALALSLWQIISFALRNMGSVLDISNDSDIQLVFGILEAVLSLLLFILLLKKRQIKQNILPLGLIIFGAGFAFMVGCGRSGWNFMPSRYMTFPLLILIGNLAILKQFCSLEKLRGLVAFVCFVFFAVNCLNTSYIEFAGVEYWRADKSFRASVLENYRLASLQQLVVLIYPHFRTYEQAYDWIEKIEQNNLSVFYKGK